MTWRRPPATISAKGGNPVESTWIQIATAVGLLLSGIGLIGTMATVLILARQTRAIQQATVTSAYQSIISMGNAFNAALIDHPEVFFALTDPTLVVEHWDFSEQMRLRPRVAVAATQQLDYFELVLVTIRAFPRSLQDEWQDYIRGIITRSPYIRRALLDNDWYTEELRAIASDA